MENQKKSKKKLVGIIIAVIAVIIVILAVAGNDEVADDMKKFINEDMQTVIDNRNEIIALGDNASEFDDTDFEGVYLSIKDEILPKANEILVELEKVHPETDEVKELKALNVEGFTLIKEGYEKIISAFDNFDEEALNDATDLVDQGWEKINEYDKKLEDLAKEHDLELS